MIQIAIVEDEEIYVKQLTEYIRKYQTERGRSIKVTVFGDGEDITENYNGGFDIILMDIQMRFMDGMTAAEKIRQMDQKVIIMFITNMSQYAIRGYAVDALDYVLKPVSYFALTQKLDRAITRMKKRVKKYITISTSSGVRKMNVSEIYWIESQGHRLTYHTKQGEYEATSNSMKEIEEKLSEENFFRCNKGYLLNLQQVNGIQDGYAIVNDKKLIISRARKNDFLKALTNYVGEDVK